MLPEREGRRRVVEVAREWLGTPYHDCARLKGVGADCATLIAEVFAEAGTMPPVEIAPYSPQWHLHQGEEQYLNRLLEYAHEIEGPPLPADIVMFRFGRLYSHGAIVVAWPVIIHARAGRGCELEDADRCQWLARIGEGQDNPAPPRPRKFLSLWGKP